MLHFPSTLKTSGSNGMQSKSDRHSSLNATQQKSASNPLFLKIEEELHDARRVHSHGQEEDLRLALDMVINRVSELSNLLNEAYKAQAELEVQLNVAKSNLQLVISNNEMLEDALKRDSSARDLGWRRTSGRDNEARDPRSALERSQSVDYAYVPEIAQPSPPVSAGTPTDNRFFKFRFTSASAAPVRSTSRPGTPNTSYANGVQHHLTSPSMPSLTSHHAKELEDMTAELEKERAARKAIVDEKAALEAELESLSQALFEEANKMVATERMKRAETEEELQELRQEKEALKSALRLVDGENLHLKGSTPDTPSFANVQSDRGSISSAPSSRTHSRTSSRVGIKSRPESLDLTNSLPPLPPSPFPDPPLSALSSTSASTSPSAYSATETSSKVTSDSDLQLTLSPLDEDSQPTPRYHQSSLHSSSVQDLEPSPWADAPSNSFSADKNLGGSLFTAGFAGIR